MANSCWELRVSRERRVEQGTSDGNGIANPSFSSVLNFLKMNFSIFVEGYLQCDGSRRKYRKLISDVG